MVRIPTHIDSLVSYKPGKPIATLVKELNLTEYAVLWNNENNLGPSHKVVKAIADAATQLHQYPDPASLALRIKLAEKNNCSTDNIVVDNGSEALLENLFRSMFDDGDELLTSEGTFVAVYIWAKANNRQVKKIPLTRGYGFDTKRVLDELSPSTKAVYISNPNNPTGTIVTQDALKSLLSVLPENILVIVDEAYYEYAKEISDVYPNSFALGRPNVVTLRTLSKAYGIAGMRIGYALGPKKLIEAMAKVKMTFAPSNIAQAAAIAALSDQEHMHKATKLNKAALGAFYGALHEAELTYVPSFGNFVMIDLITPEKALAFTAKMIQKGVFVRHLAAFGLPHCVRVSTGTEEENGLFVRCLKG